MCCFQVHSGRFTVITVKFQVIIFKFRLIRLDFKATFGCSPVINVQLGTSGGLRGIHILKQPHIIWVTFSHWAGTMEIGLFAVGPNSLDLNIFSKLSYILT